MSFSEKWKNVKMEEDGPFYDFIIEVVTEFLLNALSHGELSEKIDLDFGQAEEVHNIPKWVYISCNNRIGKKYPSGREVGITTLNETVWLLNSEKRGVDTSISEDSYTAKAWLLPNYLRPLKKG